MSDMAVMDLADEYWAFHRRTAQLWNIDRGDVDQIEAWEDFSSTAVDSRISQLDGFAARAAVLTDDVITGGERAVLAAVAFSARSSAAMVPYARDLTLVAGPMNITAFMTVMVPGYGLVTRDHGRGYVAKLHGVPAFIDGWIDGLRAGVHAARTATARGVRAAVAELDAVLAADPADDHLVHQPAPTNLSEREAELWRAELVEVVVSAVRPAMAALRKALHDEVLPVARADDRAGICFVPGGSSDYQNLLHAATSTDLSAEAMHTLGRDQLSLLDEQYRDLGAAVFGAEAGDPRTIRARLRDDVELRHHTPADVIADAQAALTRAATEAHRWFVRLPDIPCTIVAVQSGGLAFYTGPAPDGGRGGTCFFNVSDPTLWTRFNVEVTTFHESVPGHHLQLALAQGLDLHPVLGELEVTSFGEGWGLYSERLADEMGLYTGPLQRLGMLTLDSLRSARLVIDTGLHAFGWSREQAITQLLDSTSLSRRIAESEVDRYIADPGQATSYMVGRLHLQRLRSDAESRLRDRFSVATFHDTLLGNGMMPLPELSRTVDDWIIRTLSSRAV
jgi:uncharacterized protein (DUF885 family)